MRAATRFAHPFQVGTSVRAHGRNYAGQSFEWRGVVAKANRLTCDVERAGGDTYRFQITDIDNGAEDRLHWIASYGHTFVEADEPQRKSSPLHYTPSEVEELLIAVQEEAAQGFEDRLRRLELALAIRDRT